VLPYLIPLLTYLIPVYFSPNVLAAPIIIALMTEAASTSETSVNFCQTTLRYNPGDSHLLINEVYGAMAVLLQYCQR
jgi:hypothetical protein